jgi:hypothetical protein
MGAVSPVFRIPARIIRMISTKKTLITSPTPIRLVPSQPGFKIFDDDVKQTRRQWIRDLPLQTPIIRDLELLLFQLVLCHQTGPPANRRADSRAVSLKFSDHFAMVSDR